MTQADAPQVTMHELAVLLRAVAQIYSAQPDQETLNTLDIVANTDENDLPDLSRWHKRSGRAKKKMIDAAFVVLADAGLFEVSSDQLFITLTERGAAFVQLAQEQPDALVSEIEAAIEGSEHFAVQPEPAADDTPADEPEPAQAEAEVPTEAALDEMDGLAVDEPVAADESNEVLEDAPTTEPPPSTDDPLAGLEGLALGADSAKPARTSRRRRNLRSRAEASQDTTPEAATPQDSTADLAPDDALGGLEGLALNEDEADGAAAPPPRRRRRGLLSRRRAERAEQAASAGDSPSETPGYEADVADDTPTPSPRRRRLGNRPAQAPRNTLPLDTPFSSDAAPTAGRRRASQFDTAPGTGAGRRQLPSRNAADAPPARRLRRSRLDERVVGPRANSKPPAPATDEPLETIPLRDGRTLKISRHTLDLLVAEHGSVSNVILWYEQNADLLNDDDN